jgi:arabinogalactan oligomer/maltooligosaccharide transport system permease protein
LAKVDRAKRKALKRLSDGGTPSLRGTLIKIAILGLLDAFLIFMAMILIGQHNWGFLIGVVLTGLAINYIYLRRGQLPAKYLAPGLILLLIFQVYVVFLSSYTAFTNYGSFHNGSFEDAVGSIKQTSVVPADESPYYNVTVGKDSAGKYELLLVNPDTQKVYIGGGDWKTDGLREITNQPGVKILDSGYASSPKGFTKLTDKEITDNQEAITTFKVPISASIDKDGFISTQDTITAQIFKFAYVWHADTKSFVRDADGAVFKASADGFFRSAATHEKLDTGWQVPVGVSNFATIFGNAQLRTTVLGIFAWTMVFAIMSVLTTFVVGLSLALLFDDERLRGKKIYRSIMILPYAFPGFLSAFIWHGLFDTKQGFINNGILGHAMIPWLEDPTLAKVSVLLVNLWLGFPYMFLISTGALQAIPGELAESATIDGATAWQQFRLIKLPLLLVSLAPLLISSFAFNFNNFSIIYLLTGGGPTVANATEIVSPGATDILITFVYKIAFATPAGRDYGLASAFSLLIFVLVGTLSLISFRNTRSLEEVN